jgi:hypothetical protein
MVHPHVQRAIEAEAEAAVPGVELVAAHTQVGQQAVDGQRLQEAQVVLQPTEVGTDQREAIVLWSVGPGVAITVEDDQPALWTEDLENGPAVSAASEGDVYVDAVGADVQPFDTGL